MKKLLLLSALTLVILSSCKKEQSSVVGTWQMYQDGKPFTLTYGNDTMHRYKIINEKSFIVIQTAHHDSIFNGYFVGDYKVEDNIYTEHIRSTNPAFSEMLGKSMAFDMELKDDVMQVQGINNEFSSTWMRVSLDNLEYLKDSK